MFLGVVIGFCIVPLAAFVFVKSGGMPVATKGKPPPFERFLAHVALDAAIYREAGKPAPIEATDANLAAGAKIYEEQCMVCHGSPDRAWTAIALECIPKPPPLVRMDSGVTDDSAGETIGCREERNPTDRHARIWRQPVGNGTLAGKSSSPACARAASSVVN